MKEFWKGVIGGAVAITVLSIASAAIDSADAEASPSLRCPAAYTAREVRIYGQRLESEPDRRGERKSVVTQNDWNSGTFEDPRYVVAYVCTRATNERENNELFQWGSGGPR